MLVLIFPVFSVCDAIWESDPTSHMMFIGEVTESKVLGNGPSCTYAHYHKAIRQKAK